MVIYTNHTRHSAIVTIKVESTENPEAALEIGEPDAFKTFPGAAGVHDYIVDGGKELRTVGQTTASFVSVRSLG